MYCTQSIPFGMTSSSAAYRARRREWQSLFVNCRLNIACRTVPDAGVPLSGFAVTVDCGEHGDTDQPVHGDHEQDPLQKSADRAPSGE